MNERKSLIKLLCSNFAKILSKTTFRVIHKYNLIKDSLKRRVYIDNKTDLIDLAPVDEIKNGEEYFKALDWALNAENVKNIAISGPYGSGKSSVIHAYLKKHPSIKAINISLASFLEGKEDIDGTIEYSLVDLGGEDKIEEGILKQLFYKVNYKKIPQSRYRKLHNINGVKLFINLFILITIVTGAISFFIPNFFTTIINVISETAAKLGISNVLSVVISAFLILFSIGIISYVLWCLFSKYQLKEFNLSNKASVESKNMDTDSIFNKNLDEIVYFFEATDFDTVFIEDLDRFKSSKIFIKLRELNTILNNYEMIKRKIIFVYAIKDDMFVSTERTKFFDMIIPVVPIINSTNSGEILLKRLEQKFEIENNDIKYKYNITPQYVTQISPYIEDMRVLTNIYNEFVIYKNTLGINQDLKLIDELMMSLVVFKNIYPKEFADLQMEKGIVKEAFENKKKFILEQIDKLNEHIIRMENILQNIEKDALRNIKELKAAMLYYLSEQQGTVKNITTNGINYDFNMIMDNDFNINLLNNNQLHVSYIYANGTSRNKTINDNNSEFQDLKNYFKRWEYLKNSTPKKQAEIKSNIEKLRIKEKKIKSLKIKSLITEYTAEEVLSQEVSNNKLLVFLLRTGYIDETYPSYMNYFHPNSITKEEMNFILSIRNYEKIDDYSYPLVNCEQVVDRLLEYEFEQKEILNFDLLDYLLKECKNDNKCTKFLEQLSNEPDVYKDFIIQYIDRGENVSIFINLIAKNKDYLWLDIYEDKILTDYQKYNYFILIIKYADVESIINNDNAESDEIDNPIKEFILRNEDILVRLNDVDEAKIENIIDSLHIKFSQLICEGVSDKILEYIFSNNFYNINLTMLNNIFLLKQPDKVQNLLTENYTTIRELQYQPLIDYVDENFINYIKNIVIAIDTNVNETIDTVLLILSKLINTEISYFDEVIQKENVILQSFDDCLKNKLEESNETKEIVKSIWNMFLSQNKVLVSWKNIIIYWEQFDLSEDLLKFIEDNINILLQSNDSDLVNDNLIVSFITNETNMEVYQKFLEKFKLTEFTSKISEFTKSQIEIMLNCSYFEITPERLNEIRLCYPEYCITFIENNRDLFITNLNLYTLKIEEVEELVYLNVFSDDEKLMIINSQDVSEMTSKIAMKIRDMRIDVSKNIVEKAWENLIIDARYELLINHIRVFSLEELEQKFIEFGNVYMQLTDRSKKHKVTFDNTEFNQKLMNYLDSVGYLSSIAIEARETEDIITHQKMTITNIVGWIKKV